jgi:hypothetical protein
MTRQRRLELGHVLFIDIASLVDAHNRAGIGSPTGAEIIVKDPCFEEAITTPAAKESN